MVDPWTRGGGCRGLHPQPPAEQCFPEHLCQFTRSKQIHEGSIARPVAIDGYLSIFLKPDDVKPQ